MILGFLTPSGLSSPENILPQVIFFFIPQRKTLTKSPPETMSSVNGSQSAIPVPATSAGKLLEMQILEPLPKPIRSGTLGVGPSSLWSNKPSG